jgi:hypothetical protein
MDEAYGKYAVQINLIGQLHLLSSTVTTLAVPSPSLLATLARKTFISLILFFLSIPVIMLFAGVLRSYH